MTRKNDSNVVSQIYEILKEALKDPLKAPKASKKKPEFARSKKSLLVNFSDVHVGQITETYNLDRFIARFDELFDHVELQLMTIQDLDELGIALLGDIVDGDNIHPGHAYSVALPVVKQYLFFAEKIRERVESILARFKGIKIRFFGVGGNHERPGRKGEGHPLNSWAIALFEHLRASFRNHPQISCEFSERWAQIVDFGGKKIFFHHGDKMGGSGSLQTIFNAHKSWALSMPQWDIAIFGHFHKPNKFHIVDRIVSGNGTFTSDDFDFELGTLKDRVVPSQKLVLFDGPRVVFEDYYFRS